jgi:hypothetical protein
MTRPTNTPLPVRGGGSQDRLLRLAWLAGANRADLLSDAVRQAITDGYTWPQIARAHGQPVNTVRSKYLYPTATAGTASARG